MNNFTVMKIVLYFFLVDTIEPILIMHPSDQTLEGGNVTLKCIYNTYPPINVTRFLHEGREISRNTNNKILELSNVKKEDTGRYQCAFDNYQGNFASNSVSLHVKCKIDIFVFD